MYKFSDDDKYQVIPRTTIKKTKEIGQSRNIIQGPGKWVGKVGICPPNIERNTNKDTSNGSKKA